MSKFVPPKVTLKGVQLYMYVQYMFDLFSHRVPIASCKYTTLEFIINNINSEIIYMYVYLHVNPKCIQRYI